MGHDMNEPGNTGNICSESVRLEQRARHALWVIEHNAPGTFNAIQEHLPSLWSKFAMDDLRAFAAEASQ